MKTYNIIARRESLPGSDGETKKISAARQQILNKQI
jgi:hypothetical protein